MPAVASQDGNSPQTGPGGREKHATGTQHARDEHVANTGLRCVTRAERESELHSRVGMVDYSKNLLETRRATGGPGRVVPNDLSIVHPKWMIDQLSN